MPSSHKERIVYVCNHIQEYENYLRSQTVIPRTQLYPANSLAKVKGLSKSSFTGYIISDHGHYNNQFNEIITELELKGIKKLSDNFDIKNRK
jgi:hypothetical protein